MLVKNIMNTQDITLLIAAIGAMLGSVIYSLKHVKKSDCCGSSCTQDTNRDIEMGKISESTEL
tara:strand:- start:97 stop:285 length:189 start_codon:yes stop_codon:yes gene_type:complete